MCGFCVVFLSRSWRLVSFLLFCVVCCRINVRSFWPSDGRRWFPNTKKKSWVLGQIRAERVLADTIMIDGRKEWISKFCPEANVWTWWRCRRCHSNVPACLQVKHKQAIRAKNNGWSSGSSSSSGGEEKRSRDQEEEIKQLRGEGAGGAGRADERRSGLEEDCKMECEEDIDCKKKLDERRKSLQKQLRDIEKFTDMEPLFRDSQKEWKGQLQDIERKRTELFPEHQKMQKRSRKLQCLQDKKRNFTKEACSCEEETRKASEEAELWQLSDGSR